MYSYVIPSEILMFSVQVDMTQWQTTYTGNVTGP